MQGNPYKRAECLTARREQLNEYDNFKVATASLQTVCYLVAIVTLKKQTDKQTKNKQINLLHPLKRALTKLFFLCLSWISSITTCAIYFSTYHWASLTSD